MNIFIVLHYSVREKNINSLSQYNRKLEDWQIEKSKISENLKHYKNFDATL